MNKLFKATVDHYAAMRSEALAILDIYFNNAVGIGEHSDLLEEVRQWTEKLDQAESVLETLGRNFPAETNGQLPKTDTKVTEVA